MKFYTMVLIGIIVLVMSAYCTYKLVSGDNPAEDARLYREASKINPSCANWCAEIGYVDGDDLEAKRCLKRVIETRSCR